MINYFTLITHHDPKKRKSFYEKVQRPSFMLSIGWGEVNPIGSLGLKILIFLFTLTSTRPMTVQAMTVQEKIDFYRKLTLDRAKWANEVVSKIKRVDTSNIKLGTTFTPGEQYSKVNNSQQVTKTDQEYCKEKTA